MNRNLLISTGALSIAFGLLPVAAIADHIDALPNAANPQSSADSQFVGTSKFAAPARAAPIAGTTPPARTTQAAREARARAASMQDSSALAVPNHPEFGRLNTP